MQDERRCAPLPARASAQRDSCTLRPEHLYGATGAEDLAARMAWQAATRSPSTVFTCEEGDYSSDGIRQASRIPGLPDEPSLSVLVGRLLGWCSAHRANHLHALIKGAATHRNAREILQTAVGPKLWAWVRGAS